jgi:hypothetical protein
MQAGKKLATARPQYYDQEAAATVFGQTNPRSHMPLRTRWLQAPSPNLSLEEEEF